MSNLFSAVRHLGAKKESDGSTVDKKDS